MARNKTLALLISVVFVGSGCASLQQGRGALDDANLTCVILGGLLGAGGGWVAANPNHGDDEYGEAIGAAAAGLILGGIVGDWICGPTTNESPTVRISADPRSGEPALGVSFRSVATDPDGEIASYLWEFGDGGTSTEANPRHTYNSEGNYDARLTVTDNRGNSSSASTRISVAKKIVQPAPVQRRIVLRGVNFAVDSARIESTAEALLDVAVQVLRENSDIRVEVAGHTDSTGSDAYNQGLSERRARSVVNYLVRKGIDGARLSSVGFGESQPVADNATQDGRAQNRRVELNVR
jgi:outer membrane protein OmpA-like peptidoglycan-associated protein